MDINNNQQINTFAKGLDTDSSDFIIQDQSYRNANNIKLIGDKYSTNISAQLIEGNVLITEFTDNIQIIQTCSVRDYGVIVAKVDNKLAIYTIKESNITQQPKLIFKSIEDYDIDIVSVNIRYESENNIKLYIADGEHPLMSINVSDLQYDDDYNYENTILSLYTYPQVNFKKPIFLGLTQGSLKGGVYQYSYQLYKKFGNSSEISPTTLMISVVDNVQYKTGNDINGVGQDEQSGSGIRIRIPISESSSYLDRIKIYRIHYVQNGQEPTIDVVYDGAYINNMVFTDTGISSLSTITTEEYNSISGIHIIPKVIDSKNDYLFAANIKQQSNNSFSEFDARAYSFDISGSCTLTKAYTSTVETSFTDFTIKDVPQDYDCYNSSTDPNTPYNDLSAQMFIPADTFDVNAGSLNLIYGGVGKNISYALVTTEIDADTTEATDNDQFDLSYEDGKIQFHNQPIGTKGMSIGKDRRIDAIQFNKIRYGYIAHGGEIISTDKDGNDLYCDLSDFVVSDNSDTLWTYGNSKISYSLKSLRRGETYRYGIVLYDKYGSSSNVKWIADIKVPEIYVPGFEPFISHGYTEYDKRIDLKVRPIGVRFKVDLSGDEYKDVISYEIVRCRRTEQDIRNLTQGVLSRSITKNTYDSSVVQNNTTYPYSPSGWLTTAKYWIGDDYRYRLDLDNTKFEYCGLEADNFSNNHIYQFVSPETSYLKDSTFDLLKDKQIQLQPLLYMFGMSNGVPNKINEESTDKESPFQTIDNWTCKDLQNPKRYLSRYINPSPSNCHIRLSSLCRDNSYNTSHYGDVDVDNSTNWAKYITEGKYVSNDAVMMPQGLFQYELFNRTMESEPYRSIVNMNSVLFGTCLTIYSATQSNGQRYPQNGWFIKPNDALQWSNYGRYQFDNKNFSAVRDYSYAYIKLYNYSKNTYYNPKYTTDAIKSVETTIYPLTKSFYDIVYQINDVQKSQDYGWNEFAENEGDSRIPKYNTKQIIVGNTTYNNYVTGGLYNEEKFINNDSDDDQYPYKQLTGPAGACLVLDVNIPENDTDILSQTSCCDSVISTQSHNNYMNTLKQITPNIVGNYPYNDVITTYNDLDHTRFKVSTNSGFDYRYVYKPSIFGTYLCNIQQNVTPYGGSSYSKKQLNTYNSYGNYHNVKENSAFVFDGDTFIQPFEYVSLHKMYDSKIVSPINTTVIYSIPVETNINLQLTQGYEFSKNLDNTYSPNLQIEAGSVNNLLTQNENQYVYNTAYSINNTARIYSAETEQDSDQTLNTYDVRCYYSDLKTNNELIDSWSKFRSSNYIDVDPRYGEITNIRTFHNELLYWQDRAFGKFNVNEQSVITDNNNTSLILGTGGVLTRYDYIINTNGMKKDELCDTQSDSTLYWWDHNKNEILGYSTGSYPNILSRLKTVQNAINNTSVDSNYGDKYRPVLYFDKKYHDVVFDIFNNKALVYNEMIQQFVSFYDYKPNNTAKPIQFNTDQYIVDSTGIYLQNQTDNKKSKLFGVDIFPSIDFVVNHNSTMVKVFDIQTFGGYFKDENYIDNTNDLYFKYYTKSAKDFNYQKSETDGRSVVNLEYDYRLTIPRNNGEELGNRMRGKTMTCTIGSNSNSNNFLLQYITTKYRISWI